MSDASVRAALRSDAPLVVVEAPAGCGKTYQGADYAREIAGASHSTHPLTLPTLTPRVRWLLHASHGNPALPDFAMQVV